MAPNYVDIERLISKHGGRFEYWVTHREEIARFVKKSKLAPVKAEHLPAFPPIAEIKARGSEKVIPSPWPTPYPFPWPFPWPGFRAPHVHLGDDIFVLTEKQWNDFSKAAIKEFQEKLAGAERVGFSQLMEVSEAMEGLP